MSKSKFGTLPPPPEREERSRAPLSPRLIVEISRLLRARMLCGEPGVMAQSTARLVMSHLALHGKMGQLELVRLTHLKPASISVLLRHMEEEGYVVRTPNEQDRRAVYVELTQKGIDYDRERLSRLSTNDHQAIRGLSDTELATLEELLLRVRKNLQEG